MRDVAYFASELFIHHDLRDKAEEMSKVAVAEWRRHHRVSPCAVTWPEESVRGDDGANIEGSVVCDLQEVPEHKYKEVLHAMAKKTKAYGLVLIHRTDAEIRVVYESRHGARAFLTPLERHGDVSVPGKTRVVDDEVGLGVLWGGN